MPLQDCRYYIHAIRRGAVTPKNRSGKEELGLLYYAYSHRVNSPIWPWCIKLRHNNIHLSWFPQLWQETWIVKSIPHSKVFIPLSPLSVHYWVILPILLYQPYIYYFPYNSLQLSFTWGFRLIYIYKPTEKSYGEGWDGWKNTSYKFCRSMD